MHKYICDNYVEHVQYGYVIVKYYSNRKQRFDCSWLQLLHWDRHLLVYPISRDKWGKIVVEETGKTKVEEEKSLPRSPPHRLRLFPDKPPSYLHLSDITFLHFSTLLTVELFFSLVRSRSNDKVPTKF